MSVRIGERNEHDRTVSGQDGLGWSSLVNLSGVGFQAQYLPRCLRACVWSFGYTITAGPTPVAVINKQMHTPEMVEAEERCYLDPTSLSV